MHFGILGPLVVTHDHDEIPISAGRDRIVLAMLLLQPGRTVGVDELIDALWEDGPPTTARGQLQTCVSRLRRTLPPDLIRTDPAGYSIVVRPDELDAAEFAQLIARASGTGQDEGGKLLHEALSLWRGPALAGIESRPVRRLAAVLDEQRAGVAEAWIAHELANGHEQQIVADLVGLVEAYPLRERLRLQLMLTLHRLGRQADALAEFRRTRVLLRDELGIEPGPELQDLHHRILSGTLIRDRADRPAAPVRSLPRMVSDFTGRDDAVARLVEASSRMPVLTIDGMAGSGKTTLALRVAEVLGSDYPDVQLFLDLHGHSEQEPLEPAAALLTLLRRLGVEAQRIPAGLQERADLWRAELGNRRALIILDNAASSEQVALLLPDSPVNRCLVTSRRRLAGLDGSHPESLPVLDENEAVLLLRRTAGPRVDAEPEASRQLIHLCGRLPLAIRLAGARLAHRPRWAVSDLVRRLDQAVLPELVAENRTVASAFALSWAQLPALAQRVFRLLGLHPAARFRATAVAALADLPLGEAQDILDDLVDVHLLEEPEPESYRLHDLVRRYAATLAEGLPPAERRAALAHLVDLHLYAAAQGNAARDVGGVQQDYPTAPPARADLVAVAVADPAWLEEQRPVLGALIRIAAELDDPRRAWMLARVNWYYLFHNNYLDDTIAVLAAGLNAARRANDAQGIALTSNYLASGLYRVGRNAEALQLTTVMLDYSLQTGDPVIIARARMNHGGVLHRLGRVTEALENVKQAYRGWQATGNSRAAANARVSIAAFLTEMGRHREALWHARLCLQAAVELGYDFLIGIVLIAVAEPRLELGDVDAAERLLRAAIPQLRRHNQSFAEVEALTLMGRLDMRKGRYEQAQRWYQSALDLARRHGQRPWVVIGSNGLGDVLRALGEPEAAAESYRAALTEARQQGFAPEEARALHGIAACVAGHDPDTARRYLHRARAILQRTGGAELTGVEHRLAALDG
ncbi:BTAD domain-containing putative transcriptional regulator [Actinoplanes sp. N902-109]|uniref:AfsR/SARP family transcriptional regulator n=1 Tax=Actinoplanes sp. (strain N902-109) TaxID=649831 RepID=UPI0003296497|nr:BTAD domain-containing putative transcriptional regulator [Actinoplanes sp. N902-109]AGL21317.1 SARP family transcriptional regulator [Actinoplanes sp. N902-109]